MTRTYLLKTSAMLPVPEHTSQTGSGQYTDSDLGERFGAPRWCMVPVVLKPFVSWARTAKDFRNRRHQRASRSARNFAIKISTEPASLAKSCTARTSSSSMTRDRPFGDKLYGWNRPSSVSSFTKW